MIRHVPAPHLQARPLVKIQELDEEFCIDYRCLVSARACITIQNTDMMGVSWPGLPMSTALTAFTSGFFWESFFSCGVLVAIEILMWIFMSCCISTPYTVYCRVQWLCQYWTWFLVEIYLTWVKSGRFSGSFLCSSVCTSLYRTLL